MPRKDFQGFLAKLSDENDEASGPCGDPVTQSGDDDAADPSDPPAGRTGVLTSVRQRQSRVGVE